MSSTWRSTQPRTLAELASRKFSQERHERAERIEPPPPPPHERIVQIDKEVHTPTGTITLTRRAAMELTDVLNIEKAIIIGREGVAYALRDQLQEVQGGFTNKICLDSEAALLLCAISDVLAFQLQDPQVREEFSRIMTDTAHLATRAMRTADRRYEFTPISERDAAIIRDKANKLLGYGGGELRDKVLRVFEAELEHPERLVFPTLDETGALGSALSRYSEFRNDKLAHDLLKKVMSAANRHVGLPLSNREAQIISRASEAHPRDPVLGLLALRARCLSYPDRDERTFTKEDAVLLNKLAEAVPEEEHLAAQIRYLTRTYEH